MLFAIVQLQYLHLFGTGRLPDWLGRPCHYHRGWGGLSLLNFHIYFWAAILVLVYWWFQGSRSNAAVFLGASFLGSPTRTTWTVRKVATKRFSQPDQLSPAQPLGVTPTFPTFAWFRTLMCGFVLGSKVWGISCLSVSF